MVVWVPICTLEHEHALTNPLKRGYSVFQTEESSEGA
jgi:hypothetical protein